ncbi:MAG: DUF4352 domain-containing protein [Ruminococcus sp.]|jgi:hypothetical protein|nr:DUF4352 domain-containing protein [Ruminococcus sp.]
MKKIIIALFVLLLSVAGMTGCATDDAGHVMYSDAVIRTDIPTAVATQVEIKNWDIKIVSAKPWTDTADFMPISPREGYKLVKLVLDVKNLTDEPQFFTYLSDLVNKEYAPLVQNNTEEGGFIEEIPPSEVLRGAIVFEVPADMTEFTYHHLANDQRYADIEISSKIS